MNTKDFQSFLDQLENKRLYDEAKNNPAYQQQPVAEVHPIYNRTNASKVLGIPFYLVLKCFTVGDVLWVQYLKESNKITTKITTPQLLRAMSSIRSGKAKHIMVEQVDEYIYVAHNTTNGNSYELYYDGHNEYCSCPDFHNTNTALAHCNPHLAQQRTIFCKHLLALLKQFKPYLLNN